MKKLEQIQNYIQSHEAQKSKDLNTLHQLLLKKIPEGKLWYLDGKNEEGKVVSNPNIGYGSLMMQYTNGTQREFYQIGLSANQTGISVYIMGLKDKNFLIENFGNKLGKAKVTGYCIKFKALKDINLEILEAAMLSGINQQ